MALHDATTTDARLRQIEREAAHDPSAQVRLDAERARRADARARVTIGWRDALVPTDAPVLPGEVLETDVMRRARGHLAIEVGEERAERCARRLAVLLRRLAEAAGVRGERLEIHSTNQTTAPATWDSYYGLGVEVRAIRGQSVTWDIHLLSGPCVLSRPDIHYRVVGEQAGASLPTHSASRIDVLLRRVAADESQS